MPKPRPANRAFEDEVGGAGGGVVTAVGVAAEGPSALGAGEGVGARAPGGWLEGGGGAVGVVAGAGVLAGGLAPGVPAEPLTEMASF